MKLSIVLASAVLTAALSGADVAILDSDNTKAFFGKHYPACGVGGSVYLGADEYQRYFRGWEYVLNYPDSGSPVPHDVIYDAQVTEQGLSPYKVLILSNTASLSDDQQKAVHQWVVRGGRLLATFGSGYKGTVDDPRQDDGLKLSKGGTFGLHQLWHDPMTKTFGSHYVNSGAGTDVRITSYEGPTACLAGKLVNDILPYGAESNLLVQRPENHPGVLALAALKGVSSYDRPAPAIIWTRLSKGEVVYFAFAPEYLVSKEFNLPAFCDDGQVWTGASAEERFLMECAVRYLLGQ
jgi:hypothetical protein